MIIVSH